jgi:hypothetical protein
VTGYRSAMTDSSPEGITDDQLPEDLVPSEDNPLAEGLDPDEIPDGEDLLEGKDADESAGESAGESASDDATEDTAD